MSPVIPNPDRASGSIVALLVCCSSSTVFLLQLYAVAIGKAFFDNVEVVSHMCYLQLRLISTENLVFLLYNCWPSLFSRFPYPFPSFKITCSSRTIAFKISIPRRHGPKLAPLSVLLQMCNTRLSLLLAHHHIFTLLLQLHLLNRQAILLHS
jgi:hypothetical protein